MPSAHQTLLLAATGVKTHLLYQLTARLTSFAIRALVIRALGPAQFAFVEIRLSLLVNLALLPAIHAFRKTALRTPSPLSSAALSQVCVFVTIALAVLLGALSRVFDPPNGPAWAVITLSVVVRALAEPYVVLARRRERYTQSSRARAVSTVLSGVAHTVAVALLTNPRFASAAGAMGHLFYSACLGLTMFVAAGPDKIVFLSAKQFAKYIRREDLLMTAVTLGEGLLTFILANGEGIVLDVTCVDTIKAAYKLAGNVASMLARFFSEALEEQVFNVFHRLAPAFRPSADAKPATADAREGEMRTVCLTTLTMALKAALVVAVFIALVGPAYSYALLRLLYGGEWADDTSAAAILNQYFVYLVFMAGNGVTEAFVTAAASTPELKARTKFTTALSAMYMTSMYYAARRFDATGIIVVNCVNMAIRTAYSIWFYRKFTGNSLMSLKPALPHVGVVLTLFFARAVSKASEAYFMRSGLEKIPFPQGYDVLGRIVLHGMSGLLAVGMFAASMMCFEKGFIKQLRSLRSHQD